MCNEKSFQIELNNEISVYQIYSQSCQSLKFDEAVFTAFRPAEAVDKDLFFFFPRAVYFLEQIKTMHGAMLTTEGSMFCKPFCLVKVPSQQPDRTVSFIRNPYVYSSIVYMSCTLMLCHLNPMSTIMYLFLYSFIIPH